MVLSCRKIIISRGITSKNNGGFYCLNCLQFFRTKNKLESHESVCENKDTKILEFNQNQISDRAPFIIYVDLKCIIEKIDGCKNNPENSSTLKVCKNIPSGFSISTIT